MVSKETRNALIVAAILFGSLFAGWMSGWNGERDASTGTWVLITFFIATFAAFAP